MRDISQFLTLVRWNSLGCFGDVWALAESAVDNQWRLTDIGSEIESKGEDKSFDQLVRLIVRRERMCSEMGKQYAYRKIYSVTNVGSQTAEGP